MNIYKLLNIRNRKCKEWTIYINKWTLPLLSYDANTNKQNSVVTVKKEKKC